MKYIFSISALIVSSLPAFATPKQDQIYEDGLEDLSHLSTHFQHSVLEDICNQLLLIQNYLVEATYIISAIALAIIAINSFKGRFLFDRFITVIFGLFIVSTIPLIMLFLTSGGEFNNCDIFM